MSDRSRLRLFALRVMILALLLTLFGRLWYLQVLAGDQYVQAASNNNSRTIITPAARGEILDDRGRVLAQNRTGLVVSVDRIKLLRQKDDGDAVLHRLAGVIKVPYAELKARIRLCAKGVPKPCWNGSPYQPIPVTDRANTRMAMQIMERQELFPGVEADVQAVRDYGNSAHANAAHLLGYLSEVTSDELKTKNKDVELRGTDLVGRDGLEKQYDKYLRGEPGREDVAVDHFGAVVAVTGETAPVPGDHLVTSIDAAVQKVLEDSLTHAVANARSRIDLSPGSPTYGQHYKADSAAGVVLDVKTGHVVAMASYPTFDPNVWVGGISTADYQRLTDPANGIPLLSRATQGLFAPGSTFKIISTAGAVKAGFPLDGSYPCPSSYKIGDREFHNFEGETFGGAGGISFRTALVKSCDTVYYGIANQLYNRVGGVHAKPNAPQPLVDMAKAFGLGSPTGIDLPDDSVGRIASRKFKIEEYQQLKDVKCKRAKTGYPDVAKTDPTRAAYLKALAQDFCQSGFLYLPGDAANFAIGQGDTVATPLQMAAAYAALANGGTLYEPRVGKAIVAADGHLVKTIAPVVKNRLPVSPEVLAYIRSALAEVPVDGTGKSAFAGFPLGQVPVAGKTGTAEVAGKQPTSWFASFAPANNPQYAVVIMVSQAGQGGLVAAPAVREVYDGIYGLDGKKAALPGGQLPKRLPHINPDGTVAAPVAAPGTGSRALGGLDGLAAFAAVEPDRRPRVPGRSR